MWRRDVLVVSVCLCARLCVYNSLSIESFDADSFIVVRSTGAALLDNNEATAKSTSQDGGMAGNFC